VSPEGNTVNVTDTSSPIVHAQVEIPPDALSEHTLIAISEVLSEIPPLDQEGKKAGPPVHFGPEGGVFSKPVIIKIPYSQEDIEALGLNDASELDVFTFNMLSSGWDIVEGSRIVDAQNKLIGINVNHFSIYQAGMKDFSLKHAIIAAKVLTGMPVENALLNADYFKDQKIDMKDFIGILQYIGGFDNLLKF